MDHVKPNSNLNWTSQNEPESAYQFGLVAQRNLAFWIGCPPNYLRESDCDTFFRPESSLSEKISAFNQIKMSSPDAAKSKFQLNEVMVNDESCIQFLIDNKVIQQVANPQNSTIQTNLFTSSQNESGSAYQFGLVAHKNMAFLLGCPANYLKVSDCSTFFHPESSLSEKVIAFGQLQIQSLDFTKSKFQISEVTVNNQHYIEFLIDNKVAHQIDSPIILDERKTNYEKVLAQVEQQVTRAFAIDKDLGNLSADLTLYTDSIHRNATFAVRDYDDMFYQIEPTKMTVPYLIEHVICGALKDVISEAVRNDNIDTARKILTSSLANTYRQHLTKNLVSSIFTMGNILLARDHEYFEGRPETGYKNKLICMIELLHEIKADFNDFDEYGNTPLLNVVGFSHSVSFLDKLIAAGADVNKPEKKGTITPLAKAIICKDKNCVQRLLEHGATTLDKPLNYVLHPKREGLFIDGNLQDGLQIVALLVERGEPVDTKDDQGNTLLQRAIVNGEGELAELLINLGASMYQEIFNDAVRSNKEECLRLLEKQNCPLPERIPYCASSASEFPSKSNIKLEIFQLCLRSGMSAKNFFLTDPVVLKTPQAVKDCLEWDKDLDKNIPSQLFPWDIGTYKNKRPGRNGGLLAHFAATYATRESLAILIQAGLDIHARDGDELTPLHYAAAYANSEAVKLLIFAGAEIEAVDKRGETALQCAVHNAGSLNNVNCAQILLYAGAKRHQHLEHDLYSKRDAFWGANLIKYNQVLQKTTPRKPQKAATDYPGFPSLQTMAISTIINNRELTQNLLYRNNLSEDLALEIEEIASQNLTPPPI